MLIEKFRKKLKWNNTVNFGSMKRAA